MSDVRLTLGDLDTLAPASFDGTEVMEAFKASEGQSYKTPIVATAAANTWTGVQTFTGGANFPATTVSANYTVADGVSTVNVNAASATITLPAATLVGRRVTVRKISASAGTVTISRAGADTIQGLTSIAIDAQNASVSLEVSAVGTWAYVSTSGQGIYLGGTAAANLLDDYEEGTWTPTIAGSTTAGTANYGERSGVYTKIGRSVICRYRLTYNSGTGTGNLRITGLPFPVSVSAPTAFGNGYEGSLSLTAGYVAYHNILPGSSVIAIDQKAVGGGSPAAVPYDSSADIGATLIYEV